MPAVRGAGGVAVAGRRTAGRGGAVSPAGSTASLSNKGNCQRAGVFRCVLTTLPRNTGGRSRTAHSVCAGLPPGPAPNSAYGFGTGPSTAPPSPFSACAEWGVSKNGPGGAGGEEPDRRIFGPRGRGPGRGPGEPPNGTEAVATKASTPFRRRGARPLVFPGIARLVPPPSRDRSRRVRSDARIAGEQAGRQWKSTFIDGGIGPPGNPTGGLRRQGGGDQFHLVTFMPERDGFRPVIRKK